MSLPAIHVDISGIWKTKAMLINGKRVTLAGFLKDLRDDRQEPWEEGDIIRECGDAKHFSWGDTSQETYCLSLACCFYLNIDWVMCRFFGSELAKAPQRDMRLTYTNEQITAGYQHSEGLFAREFTRFMGELGAIPMEEALLRDKN